MSYSKLELDGAINITNTFCIKFVFDVVYGNLPVATLNQMNLGKFSIKKINKQDNNTNKVVYDSLFMI